ncbi:MAG: DHHW family protein, partial [Huintestinicola sp.]
MDKDKKIITKTTASSDKKFTAAVSLITSLVFFGMIIAIACVTAFSEKKEFSETQNSKLAVFPELTVKKYFNESFAKGIESFVSDHFAGHDKWIAAGTLGDLLAGKREVNNIYILKDRLVEKISEPDISIVDKSIAGIKKYAEDNGVTPYVMLVPTQAEIYKAELPRYAPNPDQGEFINYVYGELGDSAAAIDVYSALSANSSEYIYYRTDHHWTSRGAFIAYTAAGKKMGYTPYDESHYDISHAGENFKGTFYSKVLYEGITPDTLDLWLPTESSSEPVVEITSMIGQEPAVHEG